MPIMCYSKKEMQFPARSPGPHWAPCPMAIRFSKSLSKWWPAGHGNPCKPQCLPPVSHLSPITAGAALLTVSSGPGGVFRARGQTCRHLTPPKPSGESCPLEGELVAFVAEPELCDFRGFPHALCGVWSPGVVGDPQRSIQEHVSKWYLSLTKALGWRQDDVHALLFPAVDSSGVSAAESVPICISNFMSSEAETSPWFPHLSCWVPDPLNHGLSLGSSKYKQQ